MATLESILEQFETKSEDTVNATTSVTSDQIEKCTDLEQLLFLKGQIEDDHKGNVITFDRMVSLANLINKKVVKLHKSQPCWLMKADSYKGIAMVEIGGSSFKNDKGEPTSKKISKRVLQFILDNAEELKEQM